MKPDLRFYQPAAQAQMKAAQSQYLAQATIGTGGTANYNNPYTIWYGSLAGSGGSLIPCVTPVTPVSSPKNEKDWLRGRVDEILWRG